MSTSRPFSYNPSKTPIPGATQTGDLSVGYANVEWSADVGGLHWWEGPDEDPGYVIAYQVPSGTQPNPVGIAAYVGFWRSAAKTEESFVALANSVTKWTQSFTNGGQASTWLTNNGYWNSYDSQSLYLDSGNSSSYPGSGTIWYDLGGDNNNGTLINGITFSPSYSGILNFNAVNNQYVSFSSPRNIPEGSSEYTINSWFRATSVGTYGIVGWGNWGSYNQVNALRLDSSGFINYWWGNDLVVPYSYNTNQWYNLCVTFDGTNRTMYLNGIQIGQDTPGIPSVGSASNLQVGTTNVSEFFDGSIAIIEIYPNSLTNPQVLSNYNTTAPRFAEPTPTPTVTTSVTPTPSVTRTPTVTPSVTMTRTPTVTPSNTVTPSVTPSVTITRTPTVTPSNTVTPSVTPTKTVTPSATASQTPTPTRVAYTYYRWNITATKTMPPDANCTQAAEFVFQIGGVDQSMAGVTVTNPGGNNPVSETPPNLVDNNLATKALDLNFISNGHTYFVFQFSSAKAFTGYRWATANDFESRDPASWTVQGSNDNVNWTTLSTVSGFSATAARQTYQTPQTY